jgi:hypothetical protein
MYVKQHVRSFCSKDVNMTNNVEKVMAAAHIADADLRDNLHDTALVVKIIVP